jgi:hypothetical protein
MQHTLESYRIFPLVAWTLVIAFSLLTVHLAYELQAATKSMVEASSQSIE